MTSTIDWFTAGAATVAALGTAANVWLRLVEIRRDKASIRVTSRLGRTLNLYAIEIGVICTRRPVTITRAAIEFDTQVMIASDAKPAKHLTEGEYYSFIFPVDNLKKERSQNSKMGEPKFAVVTANGEDYRTRLGWLEVAAVIEERPRAARHWWRRVWVNFPWPNRQRRLEPFLPYLTKLVDTEAENRDAD